ncbi:MAG: peptidase, partial [Candidatus Accumulibacter sp.]|nr:peptidase [Accumulibacter sp.]
MSAGKAKAKANLAQENYLAGVRMVAAHPIFAPLLRGATLHHEKQYRAARGLLYVEADGNLYCHATCRAEPAAWARAIAHGLLHLGMGHFVVQKHPRLWNLACDLVVEKFLSDLRFATPIADIPLPDGINDEERLYRRLIEQGIAEVTGADRALFGTAGENECDMLFAKAVESWRGRLPNTPPDWPRFFAAGLAQAVRSAVNAAAGYASLSEESEAFDSAAVRAKQWFISSYPLLGAIAASFRVIEDLRVCQRMDIRIAAISVALQEIYINPAARLSQEELRFVMAHEFLHAALRHDVRHAWR